MVGADFSKIVELCLRTGIVFPSADIYGGIAGFFDMGPLGAEIKRNIKNSWWKRFIHDREDVVGLDGAICTHPNVWVASGHVGRFNDPLVDCNKCNVQYRLDHLIEEQLGINVDGLSFDEMSTIQAEKGIVCPTCKGPLSELQAFNLMFKTHAGAGESDENIVYLRPETAQLMFINFKNVHTLQRLHLPFGISQVGKAYRNEISPRNFLFRMREFEQMEIEFFVHPEKLDDCPYFEDIKTTTVKILTDEMQLKDQSEILLSAQEIWDKRMVKTKWHLYWIIEMVRWFYDLGISQENLRIRQHLPEEKSHYALETWDVEYHFSFGWKEMQGLANRTTFDLEQHLRMVENDFESPIKDLINSSGFNKVIGYRDPQTNEKLIPYVVAEPSVGIERLLLALLSEGYTERDDRMILKLHPDIAPVQIGVYPLVKNKPSVLNKSREVYDLLRTNFSCSFDKSGSIGRRYSRADERGAPFGITIDFDTLEDNSVTVRDRDTTEQVRIKIPDLVEYLKNKF